MIGRALEQLGPGPWWEYIAKVVTQEEALHQAQTLARIHGVKAWWHRHGDDYTAIPDA